MARRRVTGGSETVAKRCIIQSKAGDYRSAYRRPKTADETTQRTIRQKGTDSFCHGPETTYSDIQAINNAAKNKVIMSKIKPISIEWKFSGHRMPAREIRKYN